MKQVRIIDFLRDCPLYTRLYSPLYGYCEFLECSRNFIFVRVSKSDPKSKRYSYITYKFNESGKPCGRIGEENEIDTSECMLFPSHTYKSWKNWQAHLFKDGDIIVENTADVENRNMFKYKRFDVCYGYNGIPFIVPPSELKNYRYATKEEQIQFKELQEKFEKDNNGARKQLDLKETIEITNNIIKAQAKTWGRLHPAYELAENMGLLDDDDKLEDMYEKHRNDTFRVVCEAFCCDPKEVLWKMMEHRNEVMPKIIDTEKKSIAEANTKATDKLFHTNDIIIDRTLGIGYLHLFRVDGYNSAGRCWFCYDSNGTRYALTQDEINKYEYATEQEIKDFKELQDKFDNKKHPFKKGDTIIHKDYEAFLDVDIPPSPSMLEHLFKVEIAEGTFLRCKGTDGETDYITCDEWKVYRCVTDEEMRKFINRWRGLIPKALALVANEKLL